MIGAALPVATAHAQTIDNQWGFVSDRNYFQAVFVGRVLCGGWQLILAPVDAEESYCRPQTMSAALKFAGVIHSEYEMAVARDPCLSNCSGSDLLLSAMT